MTWGEGRRTGDVVTDVALVSRRDGCNFGYGRQLSYAGLQALQDLFGGAITARSKLTVTDGWHS